MLRQALKLVKVGASRRKGQRRLTAPAGEQKIRYGVEADRPERTTGMDTG